MLRERVERITRELEAEVAAYDRMPVKPAIDSYANGKATTLRTLHARLTAALYHTEGEAQ